MLTYLVKLNNKFQAQRSVVILHHHMRVFSWTGLRQVWLVWFRYIDDIFFVWTHGEEELNIFLKYLNEFAPCIKFTYESNKESIAFLDTKVSLRNGMDFTDVNVKPTDRHQYLHYLSAHPFHTKKSIVFSQTLQISRLCSSEKDFENHKEEMKSWFRKRE